VTDEVMCGGCGLSWPESDGDDHREHSRHCQHRMLVAARVERDASDDECAAALRKEAEGHWSAKVRLVEVADADVDLVGVGVGSLLRRARGDGGVIVLGTAVYEVDKPESTWT
jgi:hypothetical protein